MSFDKLSLKIEFKAFIEKNVTKLSYVNIYYGYIQIINIHYVASIHLIIVMLILSLNIL